MPAHLQFLSCRNRLHFLALTTMLHCTILFISSAKVVTGKYCHNSRQKLPLTGKYCRSVLILYRLPACHITYNIYAALQQSIYLCCTATNNSLPYYHTSALLSYNLYLMSYIRLQIRGGVGAFLLPREQSILRDSQILTKIF